MAPSSRKMGFWSVFGIVAGSQIGSGVFMQPATLAPFGYYALFGWLISAVGAIALALVFAWLCAHYPRTGGPYVYAEEAFGKIAGFYTGWTYWVISWISTPVLYIATVGYLSPVLGNPSPRTLLVLELTFLVLLTAINLRGVSLAGRVELFLSALKIIPLLIMPCLALAYFNSSNITIHESVVEGKTLSQILSSVALLTLWGFVGVETATTAAGSVNNPKKTIPKAIVLGTLGVALLYILNSIGIMGVMSSDVLSTSRAPFADAFATMFGGNWHIVISLIAAATCIGTANAWTLSAGQSALGLAEARLLPSFFLKKNKAQAPVYGIMTSFVGLVVILVLTAKESLVQQINMIIDFSTTAFLFVYLISSLGFLKLHWRTKKNPFSFYFFVGIIATLFCGWILIGISLSTLLLASSFTLSGIPVYYYLSLKKPRHLKKEENSN